MNRETFNDLLATSMPYKSTIFVCEYRNNSVFAVGQLYIHIKIILYKLYLFL